jgi:hypothetical protein
VYVDLQSRISDPMKMVQHLLRIAMPYNNWPAFRSFMESKQLPLREGVVMYMTTQNRTNDAAMDCLLGAWLHADSEYFAMASSMDVYWPYAKKHLKNVNNATDTEMFVEWSRYVAKDMSKHAWDVLERDVLIWITENVNHRDILAASGLELMATVAYREKMFEPTRCPEEYLSSVALKWTCSLLYKDALEVPLNMENPHYLLSWPSSVSCKSKLRDVWLSTVQGVSSLMGALYTVSLDQYMDEIQANGACEEFRCVLEDAWIQNDRQVLLDYAWNRYGISNMIPLKGLITDVDLIQSLDSNMRACDAWYQAIMLHFQDHRILSLLETEFTNAW